MLKKTITCEDFNGVERTEDYYFNLTEAECLEWEMGTEGGLVEMINKIIARKDSKALIEIFKDLVLKAYGEKSADGRRFMKDDEIRKAFSQTNAYSIIFMELATNDIKAAEFVNGIVPKKVDKNTAALAPTN